MPEKKRKTRKRAKAYLGTSDIVSCLNISQRGIMGTNGQFSRHGESVLLPAKMALDFTERGLVSVEAS